MKTLCIVGLGYIGLPTACMFATSGYRVHGVDVNQDVIDQLNSGNSHVEEPGMNTLLKKAMDSGNLKFSNTPINADGFVICVPTPINAEKKANLDYVISASKSIAPFLSDGSLVILESTVPPGTCRDVVKPILESSGRTVGKDVFLAYCPERVIPGNIIKEIVENDRIVGGIDEQSIKKAKMLYSSFVKGKIYETDATSAEMIKLMENTYRDVNIALANEFAMIGEKVGINIWNAIYLANKHPRVNIHLPGPGVGGHCIPIVPWFIVEKARECTPLIQAARRINDNMPRKILEYLRNMVDLTSKPVITIWGVAFKPNTDDASFSPATTIIHLLMAEGAIVKAHDPLVKKYTVPLLDLHESTKNSECIVIVANHDYYKSINIKGIAKTMKCKRILDTRNSIEKSKWESEGFEVFIFGDFGN
ncbi:MAG: nucleotide sugar dehydrogenase [Promethearchaeota archaeon]